MQIQIDKSDAFKILDALRNATAYLVLRDKMNAAIHLATTARYSPITSQVESARDRLATILGEEIIREAKDASADGESIGSGE